MNKKSLLLAVISGVVLGLIVLHPLWVSFHAFDGLHSEDSSWLGFVALAYREVFSFEHLGHLFISIFAGFVISVLVLMMRERKKRKSIVREK